MYGNPVLTFKRSMKVNRKRKMLFMTCGNVNSVGTTGVNVNVML
jgi:hypothetical protein